MKQLFWKIKTVFKNLEYRLLVESTKIENVSFPDKTVVAEANVKTNIVVTTKWSYPKEQSFTNNYFVFFENFVSV